MASELLKMNFGDSAGNKPLIELKLKKSNHVFDGAGENIQYHSDSESIGSRNSKTRYINPAICIEPVEVCHSVTSLLTDSSERDELTPHPHTNCRSSSTPMLSGRDSNASSKKRVSCRLSGTATIYNGDDGDLTYRDVTYQDGVYRDGSDTFRLSVASLSTTATAKEERERNERRKHEAFQQWLKRKEQERREKLRLEKLKQKVPPGVTPEQREESYQRWLERKRGQLERRKAEEIMRRYRHHEQLEMQRAERQRDKDEKLAEWVRKKEDLIKMMKTREERRIARAAIEDERRRQMGAQAFRDWLRTSKNKPLPVPLNQGELSMRGSVSEMYINPIPWQSPTS